MRTVLISGGSSGIGQAAARLFAQRGYRVYELSRSGVSQEGITHISGDVTLCEDCRSAVRQIVDEEGMIDVLICNAGIGISGAIEFCSSDEMHRQMEVNFFGVVNLIQSALPVMRENRSGRILVVSSVASVFSIPYQSFYSASKSALNVFAAALRNEVSSYGIQVGLLLPGDVNTGFTSARNKNVTGTEIYPRMLQSVSTMERDERRGQSSARIAKRLFSLSNCYYLPLYNYEGWGYRCLIVLAKILPNTLVNWAVGKLY